MKEIILILFSLVTIEAIYRFISINSIEKTKTRYLIGFSILAIVYTVYITNFALSIKRCPFGSIGESFLFMSWIIIIISLPLEIKSGKKSLSGILLPIGLVFLLLNYVLPNNTSLIDKYHGVHFPIHVAFILFSYVFYLIVFLLMLIYQKSLKDFKNVRQGFLFQRVPALSIIQNHIITFLGFANIFTPISIYSGHAWAKNENLLNNSLALKTSFISFSWILFTILFFSILKYGVAKKRNYALTILGFIFMILTLMVRKHIS